MHESTQPPNSQYIERSQHGLAPSEPGNSTEESFQVNTTSSQSEPDLSHSDFYENRELSYFQFNLRVLEQAKNEVDERCV